MPKIIQIEQNFVGLVHTPSIGMYKGWVGLNQILNPLHTGLVKDQTQPFVKLD